MKNEPQRASLSPTASYFAGLDVHQKTCDIALVDPEGRVVRRWHVKTCPKTLDLFARELRKECGTTPVALGLEASTAGKAVFIHLRKLGLDVHMAHPRKLESIRSSESKTDRNDAEELARLLQSRHFPESYVPTEELDELRSWVRVREQQVEKFRRVKTQVRSLTVKHHLQHEASKYSDIFGVQALHWLQSVELPNPADRRQLEILLEEGALLAQQIDRLTKDLAREAVARKEVELLQSIPGIDYVLGLTILAEVGDVRRFPNRRKFAAYCGVVPKNRDSGGRVAKHASVRHGNPRLKWALDIAVQANALRIRKGRLFTMFEALKARVGVPKALTAVAHRLAFVIYGIWKSGKAYDEGNAASFERKRERMKERATAKIEQPSVATSVGKLLTRASVSGVAG
ncbi:MAG: IS110 family transposase [Thermoplasmata archaeon]